MEATALGTQSGAEAEELRKQILELREQVQTLERRVACLEQGPAPVQAQVPSAPIPAPEIHVSGDTVPALGRALLGLAGAYLLRALTEMGALPRVAGVALGIIYAGFWLWLGARSRRGFAASLNTATSIVILGPLLWEAAVRLHAIPAWAAAAALILFATAAEVFATKAQAAHLSSFVIPACSLICIVLLFGTQSLIPFTIAILAIGAISEFRETSTRWISALASDIAIMLMVGLVGRTEGLPESYAPVPIVAAAVLPLVLAALYVWSALRRTLVRGLPFSIFGIGQTVIAFVLGVGGAWYVTRATTPQATSVVGWTTLVSAAACYAMLPRISNRRNLYTYSSFGFLLTATGAWLLASAVLSGAALASIWPVLAAALFFANPGNLGNWNAAAFLWLGVVLPPHSFGVVFPAAVVVYLMLLVLRDDKWPAFAIVGAITFSLATTLVAEARIAPVATAILSLCSLGFAQMGARYGRRELVWMMYATMATAGWLLVTRDLQSSTTMQLVISLLLFGATLMLLPRVLKSVRHQPRTGRG